MLRAFASTSFLFLILAAACSDSGGVTRPPATGGNQSGSGGAQSGGGAGGSGGAAGSSSGGMAGASTGGTAGASTGGGGSSDAAASGGTPNDAAGERGAGGGAGDGGAVTPVVADDFEAATAGGPPSSSRWTVDLMNGQGTVSVDGSIGHNSTKSLHVNANNAFHTMAMVRGAPLFPAPGNRFFGRVYLRINTAIPQNHIIWIEAGSVMNDVEETRIGANIGALDINRWPTDNEQRAPSVHFTAGAWQCLEFMFDGGGSEARVWVEGTEITDLHVTNWVAPNPANGNNTTP